MLLFFGATVGPASGPITCCTGTSCGTTGREGSTASGHAELTPNPPCDLCAGGSKRSVDELENVFRRYEEEAPAHSPSLIRAHKRLAVAYDAAGSFRDDGILWRRTRWRYVTHLGIDWMEDSVWHNGVY